MILNCIKPEIANILRKNKDCFWRNRSSTLQILSIRRIIEGVRAKKSPGNTIDFSKAFYSLLRGKMEQIFQAHGLAKEAVTAIEILCKNKKAKVRSPDGDKDFFDIDTKVLQENILTPYLYIICQDNVLWTPIDLNGKKSFTQSNKQMISCRNYNRRRLCRWSRTSCKFTSPSRIPTV